MVRVAGARWAIEETFQTGTGSVGHSGARLTASVKAGDEQ